MNLIDVTNKQRRSGHPFIMLAVVFIVQSNYTQVRTSVIPYSLPFSWTIKNTDA
jgi:hypothetical protein